MAEKIKDNKEKLAEIKEIEKPEVSHLSTPTEFIVVEEYPKQPVNEIEGTDGKRYSLITRDEALTEILNTVRQLKKLI